MAEINEVICNPSRALTNRCTGLPKQRLIEGVKPVTLVEIQGVNAGEVGA